MSEDIDAIWRERNRERERLNRRIRTLTREQSRALRGYRERISRQRAVERRGAKVVFVYRPNGASKGFYEALDIVPLCHQFLDDLQVPRDSSVDHPELS